MGGQGGESNESGWTGWRARGESLGYHGGKLRVSLWMDRVGCVSTQPEVSLHSLK